MPRSHGLRFDERKPEAVVRSPGDGPCGRNQGLFDGVCGATKGTFRRISDCRSAPASPYDSAGQALPAAAGTQGLIHFQDDHDHRSQGARNHVLGDFHRLLPHRWPDGTDDACRTCCTRHAVPFQRTVQPAVHHARHDHAAAVRDPDRLRLRELHSSAPDRCTRRRVPRA